MVCLEARFGWGIRHDDWFRTLNCWLPVQIYWEIQAPRERRRKAGRFGDGPCGLATKAPALSNASPVQGPGRLRKVNTETTGDIFNYFQVFRKVWDTAPIFVWNSGLWCFRFISSSNVYVYYVYIYIYILLRKGLRFRSLIIFHSRETDLVLPRLPNASLSQSIEGKEGKWLP